MVDLSAGQTVDRMAALKVEQTAGPKADPTAAQWDSWAR